MAFLPFFIILVVGALFSLAFRSFHLPWVLALIVSGIVIGPFGFDWVEPNETFDFLAQIGLIFLMFMAGLETNFSSFKTYRREISWLAAINALAPFLVGFGIGWLFGFSTTAALLLGIIFMSSSIAVVVPTLEASGLIKRKLGRIIVSSTIIADIVSLVLLSVLLQTVNPVTDLPLPSFYFLLAIIIIAFSYGLPKLRSIIPRKRDEKDLFESEIRIIMVLLIGVVVTFELLGLHPIIAGFFAGLVLSSSITSPLIIDKLHTISYGIFIPVFFVLIGMQTDISVFTSGLDNLSLVLAVLVGSILAKFGSGWLAGQLIGFRGTEALTVGVATIPQLSTTLAVVFTAVEFQLLEAELIAAMVVLSVISTFAAPLWLRRLHPQE